MMKLAVARDERKKLSDKVKHLIKQVSEAVGDGAGIEGSDDSVKQKYNEIKGVQKDCFNELDRILTTIKMGNEMLNIQQINARIDEAIMVAQLLYRNLRKDEQGCCREVYPQSVY